MRDYKVRQLQLALQSLTRREAYPVRRTVVNGHEKWEIAEKI
jgi:hypothetical protein